MIIAVSGITGVGKSYLKRCVAEELGIENFLMVTTRPKRFFDINGKDKWFVSEEKFNNLKKEGKIMLEIEFIGNKYGYYTDEIKGNKDGITEIYFDEVDNFRRECKDFIAVYIKPTSIEISKKKLHGRKLEKRVIQERIKEMEYQLKSFEDNKELQSKYDYIFTNDYTKKSKNDFVNYIKKRMNEMKS